MRMNSPSESRIRKLLLGLVPEDGEPVGNAKLRELFDSAIELKEYKVSGVECEHARDALIAEGVLLRGKGRGGSVRRAAAASTPDDGFALASQEIPAEARKPKPKQENLSLAQVIAQSG